MNRTELAALLRSLRVTHGLSQNALAKQMGTSASQIAGVERGDNSPSLDTCERWAAAVGWEVVVAFRPAVLLKNTP